ncbi:GGDEF domain-containing protein, partial [Vibrio genomosp. F10]|uniref:GGDEF domain-containing protein n=1 Tax=Vibrio genomosp. F10 TaxID=723171 RepID=UPI000A854F7D
DHLTGIYNRRFAENVLSNELYRLNRYSQKLTIMIIDIDNFKLVNDSLGHEIGDEVLKQLVEIIQSNIRNSDLFARWGGDEFLCLLPDTGINDAEGLAEKLVNITYSTFKSKNLPATLSIGLAEAEARQTPSDVLRCADSALYKAKENGKNCFVSNTNI